MVGAVLGTAMPPEGLEESPLGAGWTEVLVAHIQKATEAGTLERAGWLRIDPLLERTAGSATDVWAVRDDRHLLCAVQLRSGSRRDPVQRVLTRARDRGEVRLLEVCELRALKQAGAAFPEASPVLTAAADIETALGHRDLVRWASGARSPAPRPLSVPRRRRRLVVACSGVDGAGKTTLLEAIRSDVERCGIPVSRVWLRPGMGLGRLTALARRVKRRAGLDQQPGVSRVAADPDAELVSRRGAMGWAWSLLVTLAFVAGVRRQHARSRGVVLYDRHVVDALVTLDFVYSGADLRLQRWLVRRLVPKADLAIHLDVPVDVAVGRKPGDLIGEQAVRRQLVAYDRYATSRVHSTVRLDATRAPHVLARRAFELLVEAAGR